MDTLLPNQFIVLALKYNRFLLAGLKLEMFLKGAITILLSEKGNPLLVNAGYNVVHVVYRKSPSML